MGTAPSDHRGNSILKLAEELRQRRASKWSDPEHGQLVPLDLLDRAILEIISLGCAANILTGSEYARFEEAWRDK